MANVPKRFLASAMPAARVALQAWADELDAVIEITGIKADGTRLPLARVEPSSELRANALAAMNVADIERTPEQRKAITDFARSPEQRRVSAQARHNISREIEAEQQKGG